MSSLGSFLKKNILVLALIAVVYSWFFAFHYVPQKTNNTSLKVLGADINVTLFKEPDNGRAPILDAINSAQKEILVEVYLLSDKQIIQALEDAKQRGVAVDVMLEQHPFGGGSLNNTSEKELESHNISFEWTNPSFTLTHEKSIVVDGVKAYVGSVNLSTQSMDENRELGIMLSQSDSLQALSSTFENDWNKGKNLN